MKKISILILMVFGYFSNATAFEGVNFGVSLMAGAFEVDGAKEEFKGAHVGTASPGDVSKTTSSEGDEAHGEFAIGSIFAEAQITEVLGIGIDYVPMSMGSETTENIQMDGGASKTNTVSVDFEELTTVYATVQFPNVDGLYGKVGFMTVDVITNEKLATGGAYPNTDLDGMVVGLGYNRDLDNGMFARFEASYMDIDGATVTNTNDSTKSITADGITGYGAKISIGKSF